MINATAFIDSYISWLKENTTATQLDNGAIEVSSPFLDRHNDYIQIYILKDDQGLLLSDDGYTIADLELSGLSFNTPKRTQQLQTILNGFGVQLDENGALCCKCSLSNFAQKKHSLMQAVLAVNDLFVMSQASVASFFAQDVEIFLLDNSIRFTKNFKFTGKSGFDHAYDFVIPKSNVAPDRLIRVVNNLDRNSTQNIIFSWNDTLPVRDPNTKLYAFINDIDHSPSVSCTEALSQYGVTPVTWSQRHAAISQLSA